MERDIARIALFAALIAGLGLIPPYTLPFGVPITAQTLGVMLCGTVLGARNGAWAVLAFVALVLMGLPLLSGGRGGLGVLASPTAGFVIGFPFAAFVTGWVTARLASQPAILAAGIGAVLGGIVVLYGFGILGLAVNADMSLPAATLSVMAFIPGDVVKALIAGIVTGALAQARPAAVATR